MGRATLRHQLAARLFQAGYRAPLHYRIVFYGAQGYVEIHAAPGESRRVRLHRIARLLTPCCGRVRPLPDLHRLEITL